MRAPIPSLPSRNVRNKKTRNPGFIGGNHWVSCDRCGCDVREQDSRTTWEGFVVCLDDWEPRHPQDFVRAKLDRIAPEGHVRPEPADTFVPFIYPSAIAGVAIAGESIAGLSNPTIPPGTFINTL